ncbi:MAG: hypothetical protein H6850_03645 [Alphaproteobacteria bacterium]|nr:MAG: hypothetical protein H6850_03645 [Alphaproteobacteria bacterium]
MLLFLEAGFTAGATFTGVNALNVMSKGSSLVAKDKGKTGKEDAKAYADEKGEPTDDIKKAQTAGDKFGGAAQLDLGWFHPISSKIGVHAVFSVGSHAFTKGAIRSKTDYVNETDAKKNKLALEAVNKALQMTFDKDGKVSADSDDVKAVFGDVKPAAVKTVVDAITLDSNKIKKAESGTKAKLEAARDALDDVSGDKEIEAAINYDKKSAPGVFLQVAVKPTYMVTDSIGVHGIIGGKLTMSNDSMMGSTKAFHMPIGAGVCFAVAKNFYLNAEATYHVNLNSEAKDDAKAEEKSKSNLGKNVSGFNVAVGGTYAF